MTKTIAKLSLAVFLLALLAPCGIAPRHEMSGAAAGLLCAGHEGGHAAHDSAALSSSGHQCGMDIAAPRDQSDPALPVRAAAKIAFDVAAFAAIAAVPPSAPHAKSRAGPLPGRDFSSEQRLLL